MTTHKSGKIAEYIARFANNDLPAHYLGYFDCFNEGRYYEAHDVLEDLWLDQRQTDDDGFYKGLIQLAGAFVHLDKGRIRPACSLFRLSQSYLRRYPRIHHRLDLAAVQSEIELWLSRLDAPSLPAHPLVAFGAPRISPDAAPPDTRDPSVLPS